MASGSSRVLAVICLVSVLFSKDMHVWSAATQKCPASANLKFSYDMRSVDGPDKWSLKAQCCSGQWQSPIDIMTVQCLCNQNHDIKYTDLPSGNSLGYLVNKGYAVSMKFGKGTTPALLGIPYRTKSKYILQNLHFHTSGVSGRGSEHLVDGVGFDGELHLVHYNAKYGNITSAMEHTDGLAVVGIFLQVHPNGISTNKDMDHLISSTLFAVDSLDTKFLFEVNVRNLLPWRKDFYVYHGSLTTPPCSESVRWIVMRDPVHISAASLDRLRSSKMVDGSTLRQSGNVRPCYKPNGRRVETNFHC